MHNKNNRYFFSVFAVGAACLFCSVGLGQVSDSTGSLGRDCEYWGLRFAPFGTLIPSSIMCIINADGSPVLVPAGQPDWNAQRPARTPDATSVESAVRPEPELQKRLRTTTTDTPAASGRPHKPKTATGNTGGGLANGRNR